MTFFKELERKHGINLTEQQRKAITDTEKRSLLLACPGSGKTTVLVIKTGYLVLQKGVAPSSILCLTFSRAAAKDMRRRYEVIFGREKELSFMTIHSFCNQILQYNLKRNGTKAENLEEENSHQLSKPKLLKKIYQEIFNEFPGEEILEEISGAISLIKNMDVPKDQINDCHEVHLDLSELFLRYEAYKRQLQLYDFDDMLLIAYQTLQKDSALLRRIQTRFQEVEVDEAQDNSVLQNKIIQLMMGENNHLFMVADDDQAIYEWRGASPRGILDFETIYPGAKILRMEQNFRSSEEIVQLSNLFIKRNTLRFDKNLRTDNPKGCPVQFPLQNKIEDQTDYILQDLLKSRKDLSVNAVLYRNNLSAILLADALERIGIPFSAKGFKSHFFNHWILGDILSFMKFAELGRLEFFQRIYYKNDAYISKARFEEGVSNLTRAKNIFDAITLNENLKDPEVHKIQHLKWQFKALKKKKMDEQVDFIRNHMGYQRWLNNSSQRSLMSKESMETILNTIQILAGRCKDVDDFELRCSGLKHILEDSRDMGGPGVVTLSTVHSAKGLEYPRVFMMDLIQGIFPSREAIGNNKKIEGERRLFYVGMTRAKEELILLGFKSKRNQEKLNSLFLEEAIHLHQNMNCDKLGQ